MGIGGTAVPDLTGNAKFPDRPDMVSYPSYFELNATGDINSPAPGDVYDNYGAQMAGYFYPPTTGEYVFYISADDNARLYLSTDADPANKKLIAIEPEWNNPRDYTGTARRDAVNPQNNSQAWTGTEWPTRDPVFGGARIQLQAGLAYYIEALVKEGSGGDNLSVSIDGVQPIPGSQLSPYVTSTEPRILSQPRDAYVYAGGTATFTVSADIPPPVTLTSVAWQKNGVNIPGADTMTLRLPAAAADNGAKFRAIITTSAGTLTSDEATLHVAVLANEFVAGVVKFEAFTGIGGTAVQALLDADKFVNNQPDDVRLITGLDTPNGYGENYGARVTGFIVPPETGTYRFFIRSDDASQFFLTTTGNTEIPPNPFLDLPIAEETGCCNAFTEPDSPRTSEPISLQAGRKYAFVALVKEGGGGDYLQVAVRREGDTTPAASLRPLSGAWVGVNAKPNVGTPVITRQPQGIPQLNEGRDGELRVEAVVEPAGFNFPALIQWRKNGVPIPGATGNSLILANATTADSGTYTAVVSAPSGQSVTSAEAVVTVVPDTFPPELVGVGSLLKGNSVEISIGFDEAVDPTTASAAANYALSKGAVTGVRYQRYAHEGGATKMVLGTAGPFHGTAAVLTTSGLSPGDEVTVTVRNVRDLKGNAIPAEGVSKTVKITSKMRWAAMGGTDYLDRDYENISRSADLWPDDAIAYSEADFDLISGGSANWNNYDEATFVYEQVTGNFDKVVRVEYQDPTSQWARAGLCVTPNADEGKTRDEVDAGYQMAQRYLVRANPAVQWNGAAGNNANEAIYRPTTGGNYTGGSGGVPAYPNAWLRVRRDGQTFTAFYSADGRSWTSFNTFTYAEEPMPDSVLVGVYYSPEMFNNGAGPGIGHSTLARFRQYGDFREAGAEPGRLTISLSGNNVTLDWEGDGTLQSAPAVTGPWTDVGATKPHTAPISGAALFFRVRGN